jgi:hypothetical protein
MVKWNCGCGKSRGAGEEPWDGVLGGIPSSPELLEDVYTLGWFQNLPGQMK